MQILCTNCSREHPFGTLGRCQDCDGILQPRYSNEAIRRLADIQSGPGLDRYRALLPVATPIPYLGEGNTPLLSSRRVGPALGLNQLYFKLEGCNPSGAFKDRSGALVAALALEAGAEGILTGATTDSGKMLRRLKNATILSK